MSKVSIVAQIAEVEREVAMRQRVYPDQVRRGKMRQSEADLAMQRLHAVRDTLRFCHVNEADIRLFIQQKRSGS